ncbi:MAG: hypothetical protein OQL16_12315 [Gammaproteobacteria bacterium]|nr:hypothetical protein [Gammaproteobacteria bacterium]
MPTGYRNCLSLNHEHRTVPYGGAGEAREDGDANYGFRNIKGDNTLLSSIPELRRDPALMRLVQTINNPQTALFSIGCVSDSIEDKNHFRYTGYIEFSFNSVSHIADPGNYFPLFFNFERLLDANNFTPRVEFNWELHKSTFIEQRVSGYTCKINLNTYYTETKLEAQQTWEETLEVLGQYLGDIPNKHQDYIFEGK